LQAWTKGSDEYSEWKKTFSRKNGKHSVSLWTLRNGSRSESSCFEKNPKCIVIKNSEYRRFDLIYSIFGLLVEEMNLKRAGYKTDSLRLAK
jgi:hypothetical protein